MTQLYLVGFPVNETDAIDRFFEARRDKPPGWQRTQNVEEADVFLINARDREPVDACAVHLSPWQDIVIVGPSDFDTGWPFIARPIKLTVVLETINQVMQLKSGFGAAGLDSSHSALEATRSSPLTRPTRHAPLYAAPLGLMPKPDPTAEPD